MRFRSQLEDLVEGRSVERIRRGLYEQRKKCKLTELEGARESARAGHIGGLRLCSDRIVKSALVFVYGEHRL